MRSERWKREVKKGHENRWLVGFLSLLCKLHNSHIYTSWHHRKCGERRWLNGNIYDIQMEDWKQYIFYWKSRLFFRTWYEDMVNSEYRLRIVDSHKMLVCLHRTRLHATSPTWLLLCSPSPFSGSHTMCPAVYSFLNFQYLMNIPPLVCAAESWRSFIDNFIVAAREFGGCIQYSRECVSRWGWIRG